jgi:hypothetical protein
MPKRKKSSSEEESKEDQGTLSLPRALLPSIANQPSLLQQQQLYPPPPNDFLMSSLVTPMMGADLRRQFFSASSLNPLYNLPPPPGLYPSVNEQLLAMQLRQRIASHDAMIANSGLSNMYQQQGIAMSPNIGAQSFNPAESLSFSTGVAARRKSDAFDTTQKHDDSYRQSESEESNTDDEGGGLKDDEETDLDDARKRAAAEPFPEKLHKLLREVEADGRSDIISFTPDGRAFMIHKPDEFFADVVPKYFNQSLLSSFKRQLNLYGFEMITSGLSKGAYFHESFIRDKPELCRKLRRRDVKFISRPKKPRGFDPSAPDFYKMPPITSSEEAASLASARDKKVVAKSKEDSKRKEKGAKRRR